MSFDYSYVFSTNGKTRIDKYSNFFLLWMSLADMVTKDRKNGWTLKTCSNKLVFAFKKEHHRNLFSERCDAITTAFREGNNEVFYALLPPEPYRRF